MAPTCFILAATNFSPEGNDAVLCAAALARQSGASMGIIHVVEPNGYQPLRDWNLPSYQLDVKRARGLEQARQLAIDVADRYGVTPSVNVQEGDVCQEVARAAASADLLLIGRPNKCNIPDLLAVRTADQILRACRWPVLVVRKPFNKPYSKILVPLDFSACSDAALRAALQWAPNQALQLFHALDSVGETIMREADVPEWVVRDIRAREDAGALARMRHHVNVLGLDDQAMHFSVGRGRFIRAASDHARRLDAELMVLARTSRSWLRDLLRADASTRLLRSTSCDLLVLPPVVESKTQSPATCTQPLRNVDHAFILSDRAIPQLLSGLPSAPIVRMDSTPLS